MLDIADGAGSALLHIIHPFALENLHTLLQHVRRFRAFLGSLLAKSDGARTAKDVLMDHIDSSGIDLVVLEHTLSDMKAEVAKFAEQFPDVVRECLAALRPLASSGPLLKQNVLHIIDANIIDKPRLFFKADDLIDGMLGLSVGARNKNHERDVVTKGYLPGRKPPMLCLRCEGKTEIGFPAMPIPLSVRWHSWERFYAQHCVCGGLWAIKL